MLYNREGPKNKTKNKQNPGQPYIPIPGPPLILYARVSNPPHSSPSPNPSSVSMANFTSGLAGVGERWIGWPPLCTDHD